MNHQNDMNPWVIRTDFSHDVTWEAIKRLVSAPQREPLSALDLTANVHFVNRSLLKKFSCRELVDVLPHTYAHYFFFIADRTSMTHADHPLLVVGLQPRSDSPVEALVEANEERSSFSTEGIESFRAIPATIQSIENNLSIGNMDFKDFAGAVEQDGIFRGFRR